MKKETLSLHHIRENLKTVVAMQDLNTTNWRFSYIVPITLLSLLLGILLKNVWIGIAIFSVAAYHIIRYLIEYKNHCTNRKTVTEALERADITISVEQLDCIAAETIYEPHVFGIRGRSFKEVKYYYFSSGGKWRVPDVIKHYEWSKEYYLSSKGLENISLQGDEFYFIALQGNLDVAYIYPCKYFVLEETLRESSQAD